MRALRGWLLALALAAASFLSLAYALRTSFVRGLARVGLEQLLDDLCDGRVELDRIAELSLGGVRVEGVTVRDGLGRTVLRAPRLSLGLDPRSLLRLKLRFTHGLLEDARIRAIPSERTAITLFDALAPTPSATSKSGSWLEVAFEHIHVTRSRFYGDVPGLRELEVVGLDARGDIRITHGELSVRVSGARGDVLRPFEHPLLLTHATFALDTSPLRMWSKARIEHGQDRVHLALSYRAPEQGDDHLDLLGELAPVSPSLLLDLGVGPAQVLLSDLRGFARLSGPLHTLSFSTTLASDAGPITARGRILRPGGYALHAELPELALQRLIAYAPPLELRASLSVRSGAPGEVALTLTASRVALYGVELRDADLAARYASERLTLTSGRVRFGGGHLDVSGWVDAEADLSLRVRSRVPEVARDPVVRKTGLRGSVRTDLRIEKHDDQLAIDGSLGIAQFSLANLSAKEIVIEGRVSAKEDLSNLRVDVEGASWGTAFHGFKIGDIVYRARGTSPRFASDFELLDFLGRSAKAHLELTQRGDDYHVVLWPLELAVPDHEPWRAKADLTLTPDGISLHQVWLANGAQRLDLSGAYSYSKAYRVDATLSAFDLGGLRILSGVDLADLDGRVDGTLALTGVPGHPRIDAKATLREGVFLGMRDLALSLSLSSIEQRFDLEAELVLPNRSRLALYAGGEPGAGPTWLEQLAGGNYQFGLDFEKLPFDVARPWLGWLGITPPPGTISATVRGAGSLRAPYFDVKSEVEGLELAPWPTLGLALDLEHDGVQATLRKLSVADEHGEIAQLSGFLAARVDELLDPLALRASLGSRPLELALSWDDRRLDELPEPLRIDLPMPATGTLRIAQTDRGPSFALRTSLGWSEESEGLEACGARRHPALELALDAHDLRANGKLTASLDGQQLAMMDLEADVPVVALLTGAQPLALPRTSLTLNAATDTSEEIPGLCAYVAGPLRLDISALDAFANPPELRFELSSSSLQLIVRDSSRLAGGRDLRSAGRPFALRGSGGVEGPSFTFRGSIDQATGAALALEAALPRALFAAEPPPKAEWPVAHARLSAKKFELASLLVALPGELRGSGVLEGDADVRYDFASDRFALGGALSLGQGRLMLTALGQELADVNGRLRLRDNVIEIERLAARDFDGRIQVTGKLTLQSARELTSDLSLQLNDFPIRRESAQVSRLTGTMTLRSNTNAERTRAELDFGELRVNLPSDLGQGLQPLADHPEIFVLGAEVKPPDPDPHSFELRVLAQKPPFRVLRSDLSAEVVGDLTVRYRAPSLTLQGAAEIKSGSFELYGKRFELASSRLAFDGGDDIDPLVSIEATHRTGGDEIGVHVAGRVSDPQITFTHSDPAITEPGEIIAQLLGARSTDPALQHQDASGAAAGILAGATAGLLTQEVRQEFGGALPVLSLESSSQTLRSARIRAGVQLDQLIEKRLGPLRNVVRGAYVEGFVAPGATGDVNTSTVPQSRGGGLLELRFPKDLVGTIEYRPVQNWRLDLAWEP